MENIQNLTSTYVTKLFQSHLQQGITYHNLTHTKEVVDTVKLIADNSGVNEEQMEMLILAAWFHDIGMILQYDNHEKKSAEFCHDFLIMHSYPPDKVKTITDIILSTRIPQKPRNLLEKIMCDADLSYTGKKGFNFRSEFLRVEWENMLGKKFTDSEWLKVNIDFLLENKFHTDFAKSFYEEQRKRNLALLQKKKSKKAIVP
jgi:HD superfamily phosphodiesterase